MSRLRSLKKELIETGASETEAAGLARIAAKLPMLRLSKNRRPLIVLRYATAIVLIIALVVGLSQNSIPGEATYSIKRLSEQTIATFYPTYEKVIMVRRAQEIRSLVRKHASNYLVATTLTSYNAAASQVYDSSANYATFDACKTTLNQALQSASGIQRQEIARTITDIPT